MDERYTSDLSLIRRSDDLDSRNVIHCSGGGTGIVRGSGDVVALQTDVELETLGKLGSVREELSRVQELERWEVKTGMIRINGKKESDGSVRFDPK